MQKVIMLRGKYLKPNGFEYNYTTPIMFSDTEIAETWLKHYKASQPKLADGGVEYEIYEDYIIDKAYEDYMPF